MILAVIPARAGSTRIHAKNLQPLGRHTLVELAANAARLANIDRIVVSTNDPAIARGLEVVERPDEISGPTADIAAATRHVLVECEARHGVQYDTVVTLQPTIPVRPAGFIAAMLERKRGAGAVAALTVVPTVPWVWRIEDGQARNEWHPGPYPRSQDVAHTWAQEINAVQIANRDVVLAGKRWGLPLLLCELPRWACIDIDDLDDLREAWELWATVSRMRCRSMRTHLVRRICPMYCPYSCGIDEDCEVELWDQTLMDGLDDEDF